MNKAQSQNTKHPSRADMLDMLAWYTQAGVDVCVGDSSRDHFAAEAQASETQATENAPTPDAPAQARADNVQNDPVARDKPVHQDKAEPRAPALRQKPVDAMKGDPEKARKLAMGAQSLEELRQCLENLEECALRERATQLVFCDGNPKADIMLVGKAPGREEDLLGRAFAGRSGELLDRMLRAIELDRNGVYLANIVPWRPPGSRDPAPHEISICLPFILRQIELVAPRIVVGVGEMATRTLLGTGDSLLSLRGKWHGLKAGEHEMKMLATLHPEFLLKQPAQKRQAWHDLQILKREIGAP